MVVVSSTSPSLKSNFTPQLSTAANHHLSNPYRHPISPSLLYLGQIYGDPTRHKNSKAPSSSGFFSVKAYVDNPNSISSFASKVIGSLPVVGLIARILSDEGGLGGDTVDFAEFRRRVGKKCTTDDSRAFYEFQDRRGRAGDPLYVLMCCWVAAIGAGLLKSEEILEGAARLRVSNDIEFEEQNFISLINEAKERRAKLKAPTPVIPMEIRVEKALEGIYLCCFGKDPIEEEDERLLNVMLRAVYPSVERSELQRIIKEKAQKVSDGSTDGSVREPKPLSKEAVQMQMKDLQFLQQNRDRDT
ncbi:hypothetical protein ACFX2J_023285 [Malus domestica]|uniref:photosystem I assembly factor PSA3, chloroplastic n=1 Tax=Malus domestica TaxID=3750 RepID=UPI00397580AF